MSESTQVPYLNYEQIRKRAVAFLSQHHPSDSIPVPIEHILEFDLKVDIIPLEGLEASFGIVGFTSSDLSEVSVDAYVYGNQPGRYRFTLAHETAHIVLRPDGFGKQPFRTVDEWKQFVRDFPQMELNHLEWQAHSFAGLVLVPGDTLAREARYIIRQVKAKGVKNDRDFGNDLVVDMLATRFEVSSEVIQRRLGYDKLDLRAMWM